MMEINMLRIGKQQITIPDIVVSSWLNQNYIQEKFTFSLDVFVPDEENVPIYICYDHILLNESRDVEEIMGRDIYIPDLDKNKYSSIIYINGQECEPVWLRFFLLEKGLASIIGRGVVRGKETREEINLEFEARAFIEATEVIEYIANENSHSKRDTMIELLENFASVIKQLQYKKDVPFVHVPIALLADWESVYQIDLKRFIDEYSQKELEELTKIDQVIRAIHQRYKSNMPDVPAILEEQLWVGLIVESKRVKEIIKKAST